MMGERIDESELSVSSDTEDDAEREYIRVLTDGLPDKLFVTVKVMYPSLFAAGFGKCTILEVSSQVALSASDDASDVDIILPSVAIALKAAELS